MELDRVIVSTSAFPRDHLNPAHPLAFAMVPKTGFTIHDFPLGKRVPQGSEHFQHRIRCSGIRSVLFKGPGLSGPRFLPPTLQVSVQPSWVYQTVISLTTPLPKPVEFESLVLR